MHWRGLENRRRLLAIAALGLVFHLLGIARTILPAQDGLKFIRMAQRFQHQDTLEVIRGSDQHPLYPALIALVEPLVAAFLGHGPDTWRITAQGIASMASIASIIPLHGLARSLFGDRIAILAALVYVLLPLPLEIGHDTLGDSLGLLAALSVLSLGARGLRTGSLVAFFGSGTAAGVGFLARPEVALAAVSVALVGLVQVVRRNATDAARTRTWLSTATMGMTFLVLVGVYALAKGEVSEKLALRYGAGLSSANRASVVRKTPQWLPPGLDDPRWDFSPKEEGGRTSSSRPLVALGRLVRRWAGGVEGFVALLAIFGALRGCSIRDRMERERQHEQVQESQRRTDPGVERLLLSVYLILFALALVRHVGALGYLSDRHLLPLIVVALPWGAAGLTELKRVLTDRLGWSVARSRKAGTIMAAVAVLATIVLPEVRPEHRSRWGHRAAGRWINENARAGDAVLDTRGWASFIADRPSYDYWHVRQALTDAHLAYIVVGADELSAPSRRGTTLRAMLAYAAEPAVAFPEEQGGNGREVQVFCYHRPESWRELKP